MTKHNGWVIELIQDMTPSPVLRWLSKFRPASTKAPAYKSVSQAQLSQILTWFATDTDAAIVLTDPHAIIQWVNPAFTRLTGLQLAEVLGQRAGRAQQGPETSPEVLEQMRRSILRGEPCNVQLINYNRQGNAYWVDIETRPIRNQLGAVEHFIITQKDISQQRKQTEQLEAAKQAAESLATELAASRGQLRLAADAGGLSLWDWDLTGDRFWLSSLWFPIASEQWIENCGLRDLFTLAHEEDFRRVEHAVNRLLAPNPPQINEQFRMLIAGQWRWINFRGAVSAVDANGRPTRVSGTLLDETDRKLAEEQAQSQKDLLQTVLEHIPHAVFWKDDQSRYIGCNGRFAHYLGLTSVEQVHGQTDAQLRCSQSEAEAIAAADQAVVTNGQELIDQHQSVTIHNGEKRDLLISKVPLRDARGKVFGMLGIFNDITHQKRMEKLLTDARQLESIGRLAAGVAHEINTPMQYISDNVEFLSESTSQVFELIDNVQASIASLRIDAADPLRSPEMGRIASADKKLNFIREQVPKAIKDCLVGSRRVMEIVAAMKVFTHPGTNSYTPANINDLIASTVSITRNRWKYCAELELNLAEDLPMIRCLPTEVNQVILNLLVNAADAVAERFGGRDQLQGRIGVQTARAPGGITIEVSDNGCGIPEENQSRIFNPFFTTKEVGKGTGQGLSLCYGVVCNKHGGTLTLESQLGEGTVFRVFLPEIPSPVLPEAADPFVPTTACVC